MRRRSILGRGVSGVAPIRGSEVGSHLGVPLLKASRHSAVSRQLTFNINSPQKAPSVQKAKDLPQVVVSLQKLNKSGTNGLSDVGLTFAGSSTGELSSEPALTCVDPSTHPPGTFSETIQGCKASEESSKPVRLPLTAKHGISKPIANVSKVHGSSICRRLRKEGNGSQPASVSKLGITSKSASLKKSDSKVPPANRHKFSSAAKSESLKESRFATPPKDETRIPPPKIACDIGRTASLNSTAAFEEAEISTLVATPLRKMNSGPSVLPMNDSNYLAEQISLLIADQRSLMQGLQFTLSKMNSMMETLSEVHLDLKGLMQTRMVDVEAEKKPMDEIFVGADSTFNASCNPSENTASLPKPSVPLNQKKLSPTPEIDENEDKENNVKLPRKSISLFREIKSQVGFLKSPSKYKTLRSLAPDTPNTVLSNNICNQLEDLYSSDTDDV